MNCKYCTAKLIFRDDQHYTFRAGVRVQRLKCPKCGELFLATDSEYSHPYQTHPSRLAEEDKTRVYSIRLSAREKRLVENGKALLTFSDNRLQLQYKQ